MLSYAEPQPIDQNSNVMIGYPSPFPANVSWTSENATTSSVLNLSVNTTVVEIAPINTAVAIKWITTGNTNPSVVTTAAGANFDHLVPSATYRRFVVPRETQGAAGSIQGINPQNGLYQRLAIKSLGISSVLTTEY